MMSGIRVFVGWEEYGQRYCMSGIHGGEITLSTTYRKHFESFVEFSARNYEQYRVLTLHYVRRRMWDVHTIDLLTRKIDNSWRMIFTTSTLPDVLSAFQLEKLRNVA